MALETLALPTNRNVPAILTGLVLVVLYLLPAGHVNAGEIYRWVDTNGVVNYTQQKPNGIPSQLISTSGPNKNSAQKESRVTVEPLQASSTDGNNPNLTDSQQAMLDDLKAAELARQTEVAKIRSANCERSRRVLSNLQAQGRVRVRSSDGSEKAMSEDDRQKGIEEAQLGVATNCNA